MYTLRGSVLPVPDERQDEQDTSTILSASPCPTTLGEYAPPWASRSVGAKLLAPPAASRAG
eukprot:7549076-Pyramimonas_sp.AAC.1